MKEFNSTLVSDDKGFTLLEILIAIAILAFISLGLVDITENAAQTKERTTEINANNLQIETAMNRLEWDVSQIYSPLYFSTVMNTNVAANQTQFGDGTDVAGAQAGVQAGVQAGAQGGAAQQPNPYLQQYYEQLVQRFQQNEHFIAVSKEGFPIPRFYAPEKNVFEFFTSSNRRKVENQKQSHFAWVRYSLAEQDPLPEDARGAGKSEVQIPPGLKSLVRYYSADNPYDTKRINVEEVKGAVLLRNVEQLEFQFWDFQRRKWETSLRTIQGGESVIRGVRILMTWYDSTGNKRTISRVFRTHWPMVTPVDQAPATGAPRQQAGAQAGTQGGLPGDDEN